MALQTSANMTAARRCLGASVQPRWTVGTTAARSVPRLLCCSPTVRPACVRKLARPDQCRALTACASVQLARPAWARRNARASAARPARSLQDFWTPSRPAAPHASVNPWIAAHRAQEPGQTFVANVSACWADAACRMATASASAVVYTSTAVSGGLALPVAPVSATSRPRPVPPMSRWLCLLQHIRSGLAV